MTRAARRRAHRDRQKEEKRGIVRGEQRIELSNPQKENFAAFVFGNAQHCEHVVQPKAGQGKTLVIAGAGPSLRDHAELCNAADEVWGCNSALVWLWNNGYRVTHGFTVDQQTHMIEEWWDAPPVEYLLASSVHPHLVDYLVDKGRELTFFHNFVGIQEAPVLLCECGHSPDAHAAGVCVQCHCEAYTETVMSFEDWLYASFYDSTLVAGAGLNTVTRALDVAGFMGFDKIQVLGADCAFRVTSPRPDVSFGHPDHMRWLRENTIFHADGGNALASQATPVTIEGEIDGRMWYTKPDMAISAIWLVRMARAIKQVELVGDTLPNALMDKDDDFLDQLPSLSGPDGNPKRFEVSSAGFNFRERDALQFVV